MLRPIHSEKVGDVAVPNFLQILGRSPAAARAYMAFKQSLGDGRLTARQREQIALAVAEINGSKHCLMAHTLSGRNVGLNDEDIRQARRATAADDRTRALLRFTQVVVLQRGKVSDHDLGAISDSGFSELEVIEIVANIALNIFANYFSMIFGADPASVECDLRTINADGR